MLLISKSQGIMEPVPQQAAQAQTIPLSIAYIKMWHYDGKNNFRILSLDINTTKVDRWIKDYAFTSDAQAYNLLE